MEATVDKKKVPTRERYQTVVKERKIVYGQVGQYIYTNTKCSFKTKGRYQMNFRTASKTLQTFDDLFKQQFSKC